MFGFEQHFITKQFAPFSQRFIVSMNLTTNERESNSFGLFAIAEMVFGDQQLQRRLFNFLNPGASRDTLSSQSKAAWVTPLR
jgi:hypothetical protein